MKKNATIKLLSLLIATLLCFWVNSEGNSSEIEFIAPLEIRGIPDNRVLLEQHVRQVRVAVKGPSSLVARVASTPPVMKVRLPNEASGRMSIVLRAEDLSLPPYVRVLRLDPAEMAVQFDTLVSRSLPVIVPRIGQLEENQQISDLKIEPERVQVSGPESIVAGLSQIETLPLDLRGLRSDVRRNFSLRFPNASVRLDREDVEVSVRISAVQARLKLEHLPIELRVSGGQSLAVIPSKVNIEISGPVAAIKALKHEEIVPYVRPKGTQVQDSIEVVVDHPAEISIVKVDPERVAIVRNQISINKTTRKK